MSEIIVIYHTLLKNFNELYANKTIKITDKEIEDILINFCNKLKSEKSMFKYLSSRDNRLFKGLKYTLIPKIKMEVILYIDNNTPEDKKNIINNIWDNILVLYILAELSNEETDIESVSKIFNLLSEENKNMVPLKFHDKFISINQSQSSNELSNIFDKFSSSLNLSQIKDLMSNNELKSLFTEGGTLSNNIPTELQSIIGDLNIDNIKEMFNSSASENGNDFVSDILHNIKDKFNTEEELNSKKFVENLLDVGNNLSDTYGTKLKNGELSIQDIISGVSNVINDSNKDVINSITSSFDINKLNISEIFDEVKTQMNGKIPKELVSLMSNINGDNLKNFNLDTLLNVMVTSDNTVNKNLTPEQKEELIKFYDNIEI